MKKIIPIFYHIPKTGGTTIETLFKAQKQDFIRLDNIYDIQKFVDQLGIYNSTNYLISGHISLGIHEYFPKNLESAYFGIFREPVERIISHYFYDKSINAIDVNMTFIDFVKIHKNFYLSFLYAKDAQEASEFVKNNYLFYGLTKEMSQFIGLTRKYFSFDTSFVANRNINKKSSFLSDDEIEECKQIIAEDIKFYLILEEYYYKTFACKINESFEVRNDKFSKNILLKPTINIYKNDFRKYELDGDLEKAELSLEVLNTDTNYYLYKLDFYKRHNVYQTKYEELLIQEFQKFFPFITESSINYINIFFFSRISELLYEGVNTQNRNMLDRWIKIFEQLKSNVNKFSVLNRLFLTDYEFPMIDKKLLVFGCGIASRIATILCLIKGVKIYGYIDDFKGGRFNNLPVLSRKDFMQRYSSCEYALLCGPEQKGELLDFLENNYTVVNCIRKDRK